MADTSYTSDRRLYLTKDNRVVEADDPERATLLVGAGGSIPLVRAQALGLLDADGTVLGASPEGATATDLALPGPNAGQPGPDDPKGAFAYLDGEAKDATPTEDEPADPKKRQPANKARSAPGEDK